MCGVVHTAAAKDKLLCLAQVCETGAHLNIHRRTPYRRPIAAALRRLSAGSYGVAQLNGHPAARARGICLAPLTRIIDYIENSGPPAKANKCQAARVNARPPSSKARESTRGRRISLTPKSRSPTRTSILPVPCPSFAVSLMVLSHAVLFETGRQPVLVTHFTKSLLSHGLFFEVLLGEPWPRC